jgi:hypothetical protein
MRKIKILWIGLILVLLTAACNLPGAAAKNPDLSPYYTQAVKTIAAQLTQGAQGVPATQVDQPVSTQAPGQPVPTYTSVPPTSTIPPAIFPTAVPPTATASPLPPTATTKPLPCDWALFIDDVTIDDGAIIPGGQGFYKVWRLKNIGSCTWTTDYDLVYASGDLMKGDKVVPIPGPVPPGGTMDVSVYLYAPTTPGSYTGYWQLRDESGNWFGIGDDAEGAFWVSIKVKTPPGPLHTPYDFLANYCQAQWSNDAVVLPCPGKEDNTHGFVVRVDEPWIEKGGQDNEPALWTHPEFVNGGTITGEYPPLLVENGDAFISTVGCLKNATQCDVVFSVYYSADGGPMTLLGSWPEVYDTHLTSINVDLSFLDGKSVIFYLVVDVNGSYKGDDAIWMVPRIQ